MKTYSISQLAKKFTLSRSALLYYDQIGLLPPSGRTGADYRYYTEKDCRRLKQICHYRQTGLLLGEIQQLLMTPGNPCITILQRRLSEIGKQILDLKNQQRTLSSMLKRAGESSHAVNKELWVEMLRAAGLDDAGMARWHSEFEQRAPDGHRDFLISLGLSETEIQCIRQLRSPKTAVCKESVR